MADVVSISFGKIIIYFLIYIILHILIGLAQKNSVKKLEKDPYNEEYKKQVKLLKIFFKWFPFVYVIIIILVLIS